MTMKYVLGIDLGTSAVKAAVLREDGKVVAQGSAPLPPPVVDGVYREQEAELWWVGTQDAVTRALQQLHYNNGSPGDILGICIDATSGTIVPVNHKIMPLRPGLMYNDGRAEAEARELNLLGQATLSKLGYQFNASFSLPKILWLYRNEPEIARNTVYFLHQADYIASRLSGKHHIYSDASNSLKSGFDILSNKWPDYIEKAGIDRAALPEVLPIGATLGYVSSDLVDQFGFDSQCRIVAGMTDGTAACVASGARKAGDLNTTLGTTIVWKMLSRSLVSDPHGRLYAHRHPSGLFLPGGAGNSGGQGILTALNTTIAELNHFAQTVDVTRPSTIFTYPLPGIGERFPFVAAGFTAFCSSPQSPPDQLYQSCLEGLACIERWGYEVACEKGANAEGDVWTTGSGAMVDVWMQIRANILNRSIRRAAYPFSAFGSALVAGMNVWFNGSWDNTAQALLSEEMRFNPDSNYQGKYEAYYTQFREKCQAHLTGSV